MPLWKKKQAPGQSGQQVSDEVKDWLERFNSAVSMKNYWNIEGLADELPRLTDVKPGELYQMHRMLADVFNGTEMHDDKRAFGELIATADSVGIANLDRQLAVNASFDAFKIFMKGKIGPARSAEQLEIDGIQFITEHHLGSDSVSLLGAKLTDMHRAGAEKEISDAKGNKDRLKHALESLEQAKKNVPRFGLDKKVSDELDALTARTQMRLGEVYLNETTQNIIAGDQLFANPQFEEDTFLGITFKCNSRSYARARSLFGDVVGFIAEAQTVHAFIEKDRATSIEAHARTSITNAEERRVNAREAEWQSIRPQLEKAIRDKKTGVKPLAGAVGGKSADLTVEVAASQIGNLMPGGAIGGYVAGKVTGKVTERLVRRKLENIKIEELDTKGHEEFMNQDDFVYST